MSDLDTQIRQYAQWLTDRADAAAASSDDVDISDVGDDDTSRVGRSRWRRRGAMLTAAAAVVALVIALAATARAPSEEIPAEPSPTSVPTTAVATTSTSAPEPDVPNTVALAEDYEVDVIGDRVVVDGVEVWQGAPAPAITDEALGAAAAASSASTLEPLPASNVVLPSDFVALGGVERMVTVGTVDAITVAVHGTPTEQPPDVTAAPSTRCVFLTTETTPDRWSNACALPSPDPVTLRFGDDRREVLLWSDLPAETATVELRSTDGTSVYQSPIARAVAFPTRLLDGAPADVVAYDADGLTIVTRPAPSASDETDPSPPSTVASPSTVSDSTGPVGEEPGDVFVTVSDDERAVIDVRNAAGIVASYDLTCPSDLDCLVRSATVMEDTIWVVINETEPGEPDAVVRSRVVDVPRTSGEIGDRLVHNGHPAIRSAGLGADGALYAHLDGQQPADRLLIRDEPGVPQTVETGVSGFRLSDDGRHLAVSFSNPPEGELARFEITDLAEQTTTEFQTLYVNAGPAAWSLDGRYLIVDEQWEDQTAWVIDPWSGSGEPLPGTEPFLDGACFMTDDVIAHRTWNVGYAQGDARPGVVRLTSIETGATVGEIGDDLFGDSFRCHPDGSISYLRRPVVDVQQSPDFSQPEPDYDAPVELVHITPDGTTSVVDSGYLRMV